MASTVIKIPDLPTGLTLTCKVVHPTSMSVEETVTLTESGQSYNGTVTGAIEGQKIFKILAGSTLVGSRLRSIEDTVGPFIIMTELEERASDGRGAHVVTITVTDGTDPIEDALVRVSRAGGEASRTTNASGVAKFLLDDADYDVALIATGFDSSVESLTVSGATSDSYAMTAASITPPASALLSTGVMVVYDELGDVEAGVAVSLQLVSGPGTAGYALDTLAREATSDVDGLVEFTGLIRGATYRIWRGATAGTSASIFATRSAGASTTFVVPNLPSFNLPEIIGTDAE